MGNYIVEYLPAAERYLKKLKEKPLKKLYFEAIEAISENPYIGEPKTGDLVGIYCYDIYYKGRNYELAYRIYEDDAGNVVVVIMCGTRQNFYQELKRYIKTSSRTNDAEILFPAGRCPCCACLIRHNSAFQVLCLEWDISHTAKITKDYFSEYLR